MRTIGLVTYDGSSPLMTPANLDGGIYLDIFTIDRQLRKEMQKLLPLNLLSLPVKKERKALAVQRTLGLLRFSLTTKARGVDFIMTQIMIAEEMKPGLDKICYRVKVPQANGI